MPHIPSISLREVAHLRDLTLATGHEHPTRDIRRGLEVVLEYADLELHRHEKVALGALLHELQFANRFRGEPTFAEGAGEEAGTHSLHVARMMVAVADAASQRLINEGSSVMVPREFVRDAIVASCLHDMGELFGEFSTVRERAERGGVEESSAEKERLIFVGAAMVALQLAERGRIDEFGGIIAGLREKVGTDVTTQAVWEGFVEVQQQMPPLSRGGHRRLDRWIRLYEATEGIGNSSAEDRFLGMSVKMVERLQGSLHYHRFGRKPPSLVDFQLEGQIFQPWRPSQDDAARHTEQLRSHVVVANLARLEGNIGELCGLAASGPQRALAAELRERGYTAVIEWLDVATPVINRSRRDLNPEVTRRIENAVHEGEVSDILRDEYRTMLSKHRSFRKQEETSSQLHPIETRVRLQSLYRHALAREYVPRPGEILALVDQIPASLLPLQPTTSGLAQRRSSRVPRGSLSESLVSDE